MKSIMRTITVIVLVSGAVGHVGAQRQTAVPQPTQSIDAPPVSVVKHSDLVENHPLNAQQALLETVSVRSVLASAAKVLVIPSTETKKEDLPAIIEDMNVMSRIFDKRHKRRPDAMGLIDSLRGSYSYSSSAGSAPEAIYLAGYGCIFFTKVDFPLIAPREVKTEKPQEGVDPVWEQTKRQMYGARSGRNVRFFVAGRHGQYDAEQVQDLKKNLIKDLKHASNIRHLQPEEQVVLSVVGSVATPVMMDEYMDDRRFGTRRGYADEGMYEDMVALMVDRPQPSRAVMTIRARKSDIDAFAEGKIDFDKFSKQVAVIVLSSPAVLPANDGRTRAPSFGR